MQEFFAGIAKASELLHTLVERGEARLVVVDEQFRMRYISPAASDFLGMRPDDFVGRVGEEFMPPEFARERRRINDQVLRTGAPVMIEETLAGWRCRTTIFPCGSDAEGMRLVAILIRPIGLDLAAPIALRTNGIDHRTETTDLGPLAALTPMELRVLALIGEGLTTTEIAEHMRRAVKAVEGHRYQIGKKLRIGNRVKLARIAIRAGITPLHALPHESSNGSWNGHDDDDED